MKRILFLTALVAVGPMAAAETCSAIDDATERLACFDATRHCVSVLSDSARLACFDGAGSGQVTAGSPADDGLENQTLKPPIPVATPESAPGDNNVGDPVIAVAEFGLPQTPGKSVGQIEALIVSVEKNPRNIDFVLLDNGHLWRENEDSRVRFRAGQKVTIKRGIFGSFNLTNESGKIVKVKRVR